MFSLISVTISVVELEKFKAVALHCVNIDVYTKGFMFVALMVALERDISCRRDPTL